MATETVPSVLDTPLPIFELRHRRREAVLEELAALASGLGVTRDARVLGETLARRERLYTSAVGKGVALPHARSISVIAPRIVVARSRRGIEWGAPDGVPVRLVLLALAPAEAPDDLYHGQIARAAAAVRLVRQRQRLLEVEAAAAVGVAGAAR